MLRWSRQLTPVEYIEGLRKIEPRMNVLQRRILSAQYHEPDRASWASRLAHIADIPGGYRTVNAQYGRLGHLFCDATGEEPERRSNGSARWWAVWSAGHKTDKGFRWQMLPAVAQALESLGWVAPAEVRLGEEVEECRELRGRTNPNGADVQLSDKHEFSTLAQVQEHIERILPDGVGRAIALSAVADSMERLHEQNPAHWGVYCERDHLRLRGGGLIVLTIKGGRIWLALDQVAIDVSESTRAVIGAPGVVPDPGRWAHYRSTPTTNVFYTPSPETVDTWPRLRPLHFAFLDQVAQHAFRSDSQDKHQPAVSLCLGKLLRRTLLEPAYHPKPHLPETTRREEARDEVTPRFWWFGVNNGSSGHMALKDVQHILDDASQTLLWPVGNSKPKKVYSEMQSGDRVLLWTGHNKNPQSEARWGLLGTATIQAVQPNHIVLGGGKRFGTPITPYPRGKPRASAEISFLRDTFGTDFKPLGDVMRAVFGTKRRSPVTISRVSESNYASVLAFAQETATEEDDPAQSDHEQATPVQNSAIPHEFTEPTADPAELDVRVWRLRKLGPFKRPVGDQVPATSTMGTRIFRIRNPFVKAWVLSQASGRCELCQHEAPFLGFDSEPYLEVHHVVELAENGADTVENAVALCPNCHRRLHYAMDRSEHQERLYRQVPRLIRQRVHGDS